MWGRRLRFPALLIYFLVAAVLSSAAKERRTQEVKGTVRFELYHGYMVVVRGSMGPLKGLHFLVDTGTSTTLVDSSIASKLGLEGASEKINIIFFEGKTQSIHSWAPSIEIGPLRVFHRPVLIHDLSEIGDDLPVHIDAVVGLDVLGKSPFEVDYRNSRIYFGKQAHLPISIPIRNEQGLALIDVKVNHATAHLLFDSGASSLMIFKSRLPKILAGLKTHRPDPEASLNQNFEQNEVRLPILNLGEAEFAWQQAILVENLDEGGREFDGVLSPAALRIDAFSFDLESGALELRLGM